MDVVNFSGGGPQIDPANDALVEAVHDLAAAGVVPVISAGNDRDDFGTRLRRLARDGARRDLRRRRVEHARLRAGARRHRAPARRTCCTASRSRARTASRAPTRVGERPTRRSSTSARSPAPTGSSSSAISAARPAISTVRSARCRRARSTARSRSSTAASARSQEKAQRRRSAAGAIGIVFADNREGEANVLPDHARRCRAGSIANLDAARLRDYLAAHGGRTQIRVGRDHLELETGRSGVITSFSSGGPDRVRPRPQAGRCRRPAARSSPRRCRASTRRASPSSTARRWRRRT